MAMSWKQLTSVVVLISILTPIGVFGAEQKRPITVEDCVRTRRIVEQEIQISPDGSQVAYVVKAPDLVENRNNYQLFVRNVDHTDSRDNGRLLMTADELSKVRWLRSGKIAIRADRKSNTQERIESELDIVDPDTASWTTIKFPTQMVDCSISAAGDLVAFSSLAAVQHGPSDLGLERQKTQDEHGYRIVYGEGLASGIENPPEYEIYLGKINSSGILDATKMYFRGPGNAPRRSSLRWVEGLNLSPDGKYLLLNYSAESLPGGWEEHPLVKQLIGFGTRAETHMLGFYNVATGELRLGFNYPGVVLVETKWSDDGRSYAVVSPSPFGSSENKKEEKDAQESGDMSRYMYRFDHVFVVDAQTQEVTEALRRDTGESESGKFLYDPPLSWQRGDGSMILRAADHSFVLMAMRGGKWNETGRFNFQEEDRFESSFASSGNALVAISQAPMIPPDLSRLDLQTQRVALLTDLNPEYGNIALGKTEKLAWINRYGSKCVGYLIKPVGYEAARRYPLVFLAAPVRNDFISDSQYTTAYAPQPLANAGFVVVICQYPSDNAIPKGQFPGEMSAAYNWMAMVESAIDLLSARGMVDKNEVGIGGFSRTSWFAGFASTHSSYHFVAASLADSSIYSYDQYFKYNSMRAIVGSENQIGGSPYGPTFELWRKYANAFNADKVQAAVLMEVTPPVENAFEFFVALARQGKPVDLFYYPKGAHPLDTPSERVASLQRNVDWFRFWLKGEDDPDPAKVEQYARWHDLRKLQEQNHSTAPTN
jgi:dipeptidyl aminopeptidase/acylaminoacyl peptidase